MDCVEKSKWIFEQYKFNGNARKCKFKIREWKNMTQEIT